MHMVVLLKPRLGCFIKPYLIKEKPMKLLRTALFIVTAMAFVPATAIADGHIDGAIKARKAVMQLRSFELGRLAAMAKGNVEYDAKTASVAANNLKVLSQLNAMAMWPQGSDNVAMPDATRALPNIWSEFPKVSEANKAYVMAVDNLAQTVGKDLASLQAGLGEVGKTCQGCHMPFRAKKK